MVFVCLNSSSILLFFSIFFFPFVPSLTSIEILEASIFMVIWRFFFIFSDFFKQSSPGLCIHHLIVWSFDPFDRLIHLIIWSFDPFDPKIYALSLFCLYIFSLILFSMFWFSEEEMEEVRDRFFFIRSEDRRRQQNLGQNWFFFATKQFFLAHTKIWEFQFILVRLFCLLLLQKLGSGGSNWKRKKHTHIINIAVLKHETSCLFDQMFWNIGCGVSSTGMQNQIDFWLKMNRFKGNFYICWKSTNN